MRIKIIENNSLNVDIGEIIIYQPNKQTTQIEVVIGDDTVWLTQAQMMALFDTSKQNVSLHINNIFKEGELETISTVKDYLTINNEGNRKVKRKVKMYNLDVIISVGYRVKSLRGTQFRIWATNILKSYLLKGYVIQLGASLKDLGKKWFAFSKMNINAVEIISKLKESKS